MTHSVSYDDGDDLIRVALQGKIEPPEIDEIRGKVGDLVRQHRCFRVLSDVREAESALSVIEIYSQSQQSAGAMSALKPDAPQIRRALVATRNNQTASFFETVSRNRAQDIRLFDNMEEAREWLIETVASPGESVDSTERDKTGDD